MPIDLPDSYLGESSDTSLKALRLKSQEQIAQINKEIREYQHKIDACEDAIRAMVGREAVLEYLLAHPSLRGLLRCGEEREKREAA